MDIKIKYKPIDKVAEVQDIIEKAIQGPCTFSFKGIAEIIDNVYKEDSKQIAHIRVTLGEYHGLKHILYYEPTADKKHVEIEYHEHAEELGSIQGMFKINKAELDEYIKALTDISNKLEG
jgi:hypothetical protein